MITLLDGPIGSLLAERGVATPAPLWSAAALTSAPEVLAEMHRVYASAGASVHTACTFRTKERQAGPAWERLTRLAVQIAKKSVPPGHLIAGSLAPLADCYRPDLSPSDPRPEHRAMARALASAGVDLILCETFPLVREALIAADEAAQTGLTVWVAFTAGPDGSLLSPKAMANGARSAMDLGASAVLVNCTAAASTLPFVEAIASAVGSRAQVGAYANAGGPEDWGISDIAAVSRYVEYARCWTDAGATIVGSCCGTGPLHIAALAEEIARRQPG